MDRPIHYGDKILPNQPYFRELYGDGASLESRLHGLLSSYAPANGHDLIVSDKVGFEETSSPPWLLAFFSMLIKIAGVETVLEIGSFVGHSAIELAKAVGPDGQAR
jgi:predicted O-methyltransferase YrrM